MSVKVTIFEDRKSVSEALALLIKGTAGLELAGAFAHCNNLIKDIESSLPDVVLMDIEMPGMNGIDAVKILKQHYPHVIIIMQTVFEDDDKIFNAICAGASGYLLKDTPPQRLMESIAEAYNAGAPMSPSVAKKTLSIFQKFFSAGSKDDSYNLSAREKEVLQWLVGGYSYKMIADTCKISYDTVRTHVRNIYAKLHVASSTQAVAKALKERLV